MFHSNKSTINHTMSW